MTTDYQSSYDFPRYLWFCAAWADFQTPFLMALELADDRAEQDEMRPVLRAMLNQYYFDKRLGTILTPAAFSDWEALNEQLNTIADHHAEIWLKAHSGAAA